MIKTVTHRAKNKFCKMWEIMKNLPQFCQRKSNVKISYEGAK